MRGYALADGGLALAEEGAVWFDLFSPTEAERAALADLIGVRPPSAAEQQEIELSSRLYMEGEAAVMTAMLPAHTERDQAEMGPVTFILTRDRLATIRGHDPRPFSTYPGRAARSALPCASATAVLLGLIEDVIGRLADLTEYASRKIEQLTMQVFYPPEGARPDLRARLYKIGWRESLVTHIRDGLLTIERMLNFLDRVLETRGEARALRDFLATQVVDARVISEQASFLIQKIAFLQDAMMGFINIEQNALSRIFSIVAVGFLPPTLVASVFGMNFQFMPGLGDPYGYELALGAMIISAAAPLFYFYRKGWF